MNARTHRQCRFCSGKVEDGRSSICRTCRHGPRDPAQPYSSPNPLDKTAFDLGVIDPVSGAERAFNRSRVTPALPIAVAVGLSFCLGPEVRGQAVWWILGFVGLLGFLIGLFDWRSSIRFEPGCLVVKSGNLFWKSSRRIRARDISTVEMALAPHPRAEARFVPQEARAHTHCVFLLHGPNIGEVRLVPLPFMESDDHAQGFRLAELIREAAGIAARAEASRPARLEAPSEVELRAPLGFHMATKDETLHVKWGVWPRRGFRVTPDGIELLRPRLAIDCDDVLHVEVRRAGNLHRVLTTLRKGNSICLAEFEDARLAERVAHGVSAALRLPTGPAGHGRMAAHGPTALASDASGPVRGTRPPHRE